MATDETISYLVVLVTAPGREEALRISESLVKDRLCACCNVVEGVSSIFTWKGALEHEKECLIIIKTNSALFENLMARIKELHSYDVPEIISLPVISGNPAYLRWIDEVVGQ
jgi:periplasmic divalent cation tolerance protein